MSASLPTPTTPTPISRVFTVFTGQQVDENLVTQCAKLFSQHYGVWGAQSDPTNPKPPQQGARVKMSTREFRRQLISAPDKTAISTCFLQSASGEPAQLIGHAVATVWDYDSGKVCWVTQLVVSSSARRRYIATHLLQSLKDSPLFKGVTTVGLASSHPCACSAISKLAGCEIGSIDLSFCRTNASSILSSSPVDYIRTAQLRGSLFDPTDVSSAVSSILSNFYVDHEEPFEVLERYKSRGRWCLGELLEGHEFLIIHPLT